MHKAKSSVSNSVTTRIAKRLVAWQKQHGRHTLPWQNTLDPYRVWLSEIMLQQTQVAAVLSYYTRFLERFPTVANLAAASLDEVMPYWAGLGYYSRARNLHAAAQMVMRDFGGMFPDDPAALQHLPGVGQSTAAAVAVFAFGKRAAILDGNVKRVFTRHFGVAGFPGSGAVAAQLWQIAERELPYDNLVAYTQGLMDLGATLCTRTKPDCARCPLRASCIALQEDRVAQLPERKPAKVKPQRTTCVLVLVRDDAVLVETRPPLGIWGGLLSLPEGDERDFAAVLKLYNIKPTQLRTLPVIEHGFTHFSLTIAPYLARVSLASHLQLRQPGQHWLPLTQVANAALPAPIKKLLLRYSDTLLNA